jgi:hypothetical protein
VELPIDICADPDLPTDTGDGDGDGDGGGLVANIESIGDGDGDDDGVSSTLMFDNNTSIARVRQQMQFLKTKPKPPLTLHKPTANRNRIEDGRIR